MNVKLKTQILMEQNTVERKQNALTQLEVSHVPATKVTQSIKLGKGAETKMNVQKVVMTAKITQIVLTTLVVGIALVRQDLRGFLPMAALILTNVQASN